MNQYVKSLRSTHLNNQSNKQIMYNNLTATILNFWEFLNSIIITQNWEEEMCTKCFNVSHMFYFRWWLKHLWKGTKRRIFMTFTMYEKWMMNWHVQFTQTLLAKWEKTWILVGIYYISYLKRGLFQTTTKWRMWRTRHGRLLEYFPLLFAQSRRSSNNPPLFKNN